jgi:protein-disulfide isomerase
MKFSSIAFSVLAFTALSTMTAYAEEMTDAQVETIVKKVIAQNPDLIVKSLQSYEAKQHAAAASKSAQYIKNAQNDLKNNANSPAIGNMEGDVTLVEFFDYHCGYCKHFFPTMVNLLNQDKNLKIVFKEFPILADDSTTAARAALAVNHIDKSKYLQFHTALMQSSGAFTMDMVAAKAQALGISKKDLEKAMNDPAVDEELRHNRDVGMALNITGTPTLIVGTEITPGAISMDTLKDKITQARKDGGKS